MGFISRKLGFMTRKYTAAVIRKNVQAELDRWCESYEWDAKAAQDAGDLVCLRRVQLRTALVSELLAPLGLKVSDVGVVLNKRPGRTRFRKWLLAILAIR